MECRKKTEYVLHQLQSTTFMQVHLYLFCILCQNLQFITTALTLIVTILTATIID